MRQRDAIDLLADSDVGALGPTTWADLGCGDGTFTTALASLLAEGSTIHAIDRDRSALRNIPPEYHGVRITTHVGDFTADRWPFGKPDGILMANSLHYIKDQVAFIHRCAQRISANDRRFLIVEYDSERANPWVPYPISRATLGTLFSPEDGWTVTLLGSRPSAFRRTTIYSAQITCAPSHQPKQRPQHH
jgi:ubiquinone/menaquinone biosynthesis C-methylase UbiE